VWQRRVTVGRVEIVGLRSITRRLGTLVRVETDRPVVALTFDDGPDHVFTPDLLDLLAQYDAKATFFLDGPAAAREPEIVERMRCEGHCVGVHGWSHTSAALSPAMRALRPQVREIRRARRATGGSTKFYRAPYGHESRWTRCAAAVTGHQLVYWSSSARDWDVLTPEDLSKRIHDGLKPGAVVLLHDRLRTAADAAAFDRGYLVEAVRGLLTTDPCPWRFVAIPELLASGRPIIRHRRANTPLPLPDMIEQQPA
jgi:peptidoglycan-N-acetylglucosamine deacetylase